MHWLLATTIYRVLFKTVLYPEKLRNQHKLKLKKKILKRKTPCIDSFSPPPPPSTGTTPPTSTAGCQVWRTLLTGGSGCQAQIQLKLQLELSFALISFQSAHPQASTSTPTSSLTGDWQSSAPAYFPSLTTLWAKLSQVKAPA